MTTEFDIRELARKYVPYNDIVITHIGALLEGRCAECAKLRKVILMQQQKITELTQIINAQSVGRLQTQGENKDELEK